MKNWNFQVKSDPAEISEKLKSSFGSVNRFVLNLRTDNPHTVNFKIRKRLSPPFELTTQNNIIVKGEILKRDAENDTCLNVSFSHHPLSLILIFGHIILGLGFLAGIYLEVNSNSYMLIVGGILLATGILFAMHLQKDFKKNVTDYKKLISEILEF